MGLDWEPLARPRAGHEDEFVELFRTMQQDPPSDGDPRIAWLQEISEAPFATLGAPRVGMSVEADASRAARGHGLEPWF